MMTNETKQAENQTPIKNIQRSSDQPQYLGEPVHQSRHWRNQYFIIPWIFSAATNKNNTWHHTTSINSDDVLRVASLYHEVHRWLLSRKIRCVADIKRGVGNEALTCVDKLLDHISSIPPGPALDRVGPFLLT